MTTPKHLLAKEAVATHEAAHLLVFLFVGGSADRVGSARVRIGRGFIALNDPRVGDNYFARSCVLLAGPVHNDFIGRKDIDSPSSYDLQDAISTLNCRHRYKEDCVAAIPLKNEFDRAWYETEHILREHWQQVQHVGAEFIRFKNKSGEVCRSNVRMIAESILCEWKAAGVDYHRVPKKYWRSEFGLPAPLPKDSQPPPAKGFTINGYTGNELGAMFS